MPRFLRTVLLLTSLGLLLLPSPGTAGANPQDPDLVGWIEAADATSCTTPLSMSHERCVGGTVSGGTIIFVAQRADGSTTAVCLGAFAAIEFTTRETLAEGRGGIGAHHFELDEDLGVSTCRVRLEGRFHRIGTTAIGRLTIDIHRADSTFRHTYCARFDATAVPTVEFGTIVEAVVEGFESPACAGSDPDTDGTHGRRADDGRDLLHHDACIDQVTHTCTHLTPTRVL